MTNIRQSIKLYYQLAKPGIIYGNLLTTIAGFLFVSSLIEQFRIDTFIFVVIGTILVIGSACTYNNYIDREIDIKMDRTKHRAIVSGLISPKNALIYANILGIVGVLVLFYGTNLLTMVLEIFGIFSYVILYGLAKRHTHYGVLVGSLPGAIPIVSGYCAVTNNFDLGAVIIFIILVVWQMPHFYGIALFRAKDYGTANIPILPLRKGIHRTKVEMLVYTILFFFSIISLTIFGYTGYIYLIVMGIISMIWILFAIRGFGIKNDNSPENILKNSRWARKMFLYSLIVIIVFSITLSFGAIVV